MRQERETAQRGNAGGKVNHRQVYSTMRTARGARPGRRFGPNLGECIVIALAVGTSARMAGRVQ